MRWIDLGNPAPTEVPQPYCSAPWPAGRSHPLPREFADTTRSFRDVAHLRRSRRTYSAPDETTLSHLLSLTCRAHSIISQQLGFPQTMRPAPSAGAIHPVHVILHGKDDPCWSRYDPFAHALVELPSGLQPCIVRTALEHVLPSAGSTLILFAAEPALTFAKYSDGCSLIWRDAGILQGYFSAAAEALELHFCLVGVTGEPWVSRLIEQRTLIGVGAGYVGSAP